jgi:hypothetical protein
MAGMDEEAGWQLLKSSGSKACGHLGLGSYT